MLLNNVKGVFLSFSDRLRDAIELVFPSAKAFSEASGIPYPSLRNYISGEKNPAWMR